MQQLQVEHAKWLASKYPNQPPRIPAIGCLEEAGELVHAILKLEQVEVWGEDNRHKVSELRAKLADAIGDCGIFACSLCNSSGWDFAALWAESTFQYGYKDAMDTAIGLTEFGCKLARTSDKIHLVAYLGNLKLVAQFLGLDATACIKNTWETVKCR